MATGKSKSGMKKSARLANAKKAGHDSIGKAVSMQNP